MLRCENILGKMLTSFSRKSLFFEQGKPVPFQLFCEYPELFSRVQMCLLVSSAEAGLRLFLKNTIPKRNYKYNN